MKKHILLIPIVLWTLFIFYNSLQNGESSSSTSGWVLEAVLKFFSKLNISLDPAATHLFIRKSAHVFEYFVLGTLFTIHFARISMSNTYRLIYSIAIPGLISITDEIIQSYVPGRAAAMTDVIVDMVGVILGVAVIVLINVLRKQKKKIK